MQLNALIAEPDGPADRPPLVIAHGLFGSARNWNGVSKALADRRRVIAVDMRNHGESPRSEGGGYEDMAGDLAETIAAAGGRADVLGHSMGGKAAMTLALLHPEAVNRLIVADIAPVAYTGRDHLPYIEALRSVDLSAVTRRSQADALLAPLIEDRAMRAFLLQSLAVGGGEPPRWKLNLDGLAAAMPAIMGFPESMHDRSFDGPTLFLTGGDSEYVTEADHPRIRALFPKVTFESIPGAAHWLHVDRPEPFLDAARRFLEP